MSEAKIARRYARALLDRASELAAHAQVGSELDAFADAWAESDQLQSTMSNPVVPVDVKREVLRGIAAAGSFSDTTRDFLLVLADGGRLSAIGDIRTMYAAAVDTLEKRQRAEVVSAVPLRPADIDSIKQALERLTGYAVEVEASVDPSLMGGVVTRIGGVVLDGSVRTRLDALRDQLLA